MPDESASNPERIEVLKQRIDELESENERLREQQQSTTRRQLIRGAAVAGAGAISLAAATGTAAAQSGTLPAPTDPAFVKFRGDRLRLVERSSPPAAPSTGRVLLYTDGSDL